MKKFIAQIPHTEAHISKIKTDAEKFINSNEEEFDKEPETLQKFSKYINLWVEEDDPGISRNTKQEKKDEMKVYLDTMFDNKTLTLLQRKILYYIFQKEGRSSLLGIIAKRLISCEKQEHEELLMAIERKCIFANSSKVSRELGTVRKIAIIRFSKENSTVTAKEK